MVNNYIPEKGDIVWLDFTPQLGHEQRGRRPAIVLSKKAYNQKSEDSPKGLIECPECHKKTLKLEAHCCTCSNCGYSTCN